MVVHIDRLGSRLLRCGLCRQRCRKVHSVQQSRVWRDLSMRKLPLKLRYRPRRVECPRCGVRVEDFPWAEPWARVTTALSNAVARLARELSWQGTARQYGLNWKSVATIVKRAVRYLPRPRADIVAASWRCPRRPEHHRHRSRGDHPGIPPSSHVDRGRALVRRVLPPAGNHRGRAQERERTRTFSEYIVFTASMNWRNPTRQAREAGARSADNLFQMEYPKSSGYLWQIQNLKSDYWT